MKERMLRRTITISPEDYEKISDFIKHTGQTFSEFLREKAIAYIDDFDAMTLREALETLPYVDKEEQAYYDEIWDTIDWNIDDAVEVKIEDVIARKGR